MKPEQIKDILEKHVKWLRNEEYGERANLRGANLQEANLEGVNLRGANLQEANLQEANLEGVNLWIANLKEANLKEANLEGANLWRADLEGANLKGANLWRADLKEANLQRANLQRANLRGANLYGANLQGADLQGADLRCFGNMREIRTLQINTWEIGYTADTLQIGCKRYPIDQWRKWGTEEGRKWVAQMDSKALKWADRNLSLVLQIIDANPATPTGHEKAGEDRG